MANQKSEVNKSEEVRRLLLANPEVSAKEVIATLSARGISVTDSLYYIVKGKLKLKKLRSAKQKAALAGDNGAAKKVKRPGAPNKSQAVREVLTQNPKFSVDDVITMLGAKGIDIKRGLVYFVKGSMKSKKRRQAKEEVAQAMAASSSSNGAADALTTIKQIKGLAAELGGLKKLKALVDALSD